MDPQTIDYYAKNATAIADRYESIENGLAVHFELAFENGSRVLDIGCGSGRDMAYMGRLGKDVYGIDATPELVERAQELHPELMGRIVHGALPGASLPFGGGFDGVLCSAVLMHIPLEHLTGAAAFIKRCLQPGGRLMYSVPSKRIDVAEASQRDAAGRLFITDSHARLQEIFVGEGFSLLEQWTNADSLGRDGVEWVSVLMRLEARDSE